LSPSGNTVLFNGTTALVNSVTPTQLTATVPVGATTGPITLTNTNGSVTTPAPFTVAGPAAPPTIGGFTPTSLGQDLMPF
jgi:uncharacterized protein (TIGR03437 family)